MGADSNRNDGGGYGIAADQYDDRVTCPHCNRKFNEHAAERHKPHCEKKAMNT